MEKAYIPEASRYENAQFRRCGRHGPRGFRVDRARFFRFFFGEINRGVRRSVHDNFWMGVMDDLRDAGWTREIERGSFWNDDFADASKHPRQFVANLAGAADQQDSRFHLGAVARQQIARHLGKFGVASIFFRYERLVDAPGDVDLGIVPSDAVFVFRRVEVAALVQELR